MRAVQEAVRAYLEKYSGVRTVCNHTRVRGAYPLLAVAVREDGTVLVDGGRQAERTYAVTVTAASDREREGNPALVAGLVPLLLRGIPMERAGERRVLHPLEIRTEGETVTFTITLCVSVPPLPDMAERAFEMMKDLHFGV